jgi:hypothetical protein
LGRRGDSSGKRQSSQDKGADGHEPLNHGVGILPLLFRCKQQFHKWPVTVSI